MIGVLYIIRKVFESTFRNWFCLPVPDLQTNSGTSFFVLAFHVIHEWICLNKLYKLMKNLFRIRFKILAENWKIFKNFDRKQKNIQKNTEAWILIKLQCVKYQWICLNELYKLMKSFFETSNSFSISWPKNENYIQSNNVAWILIRLQCVILF